MSATEHAQSWSPEDEPATREEARAYERFIRVLLKEQGGQVPDALARRYLNTLLDPAFAKAHPRTHARMLENYHKMVQADHHLALRLPPKEGDDEAPQQNWQIHIHPPKGTEDPEGVCSCSDPACTGAAHATPPAEEPTHEH